MWRRETEEGGSGEKKDPHRPCNARNRRHLFSVLLNIFFKRFTQKAFHMNNPNPSGPQEAPKTAPQTDNKPSPQQQQSQGDPKQDKPDQQQK